MSTLKDVMIYIFQRYPRREELSNARFTKLIYLCDWKAAIQNGTSITGLRWRYNNYGPFSDDVIDLAGSDSEFSVNMERNNYGSPNQRIAFVGESESHLSEAEKRVVDFVIDKTKNLDWEDFLGLVFSTYPIITRAKYAYLDLVGSAKEYTDIVLPKLREVVA